MISILSVVSAVEAAFAAEQAVVAEFNALKPYVTQLMNTAEVAYSGATGAGQSKFQAVLASTKAIATALELNWSTGLEAAITAFINVAKAAFNAFSGVVTVVAPSTASDVASAAAVVSNAASAATNVLASTLPPVSSSPAV